ncbi:MAG TPA: RsmB/NOP family class I SAM-dependent RNA methyltransferase [Opitutaceae bacterium]|jgi:16S rRNA (cytosine967-C5)-methyltransferase|nr:RsmB/NOP family class I SAM-dependent RNA methyltransferase [Opitutaceae bacterium]
MSESSALNHAARIVALASREQPADAVLRDYLVDPTRTRMPPAEKRAVVRAVFTYFRWLQWLESRDSLQKQFLQALALQQRFDENPLAIKAEALAVRTVPPWLRDEMELPADFLRQLQRDPVVWLRARPGTAEKLAAALGDCTPPSAASAAVQGSWFKVQSPAVAAAVPSDSQLPALNSLSAIASAKADQLSTAPLTALRYAGEKDLFRTPEFQAGAFEIQDLASQFVGHACAPQPGETWWDACAGAGGKTLHLADLMQNKGLVWASDRSARRLIALKQRTARAKIFNYRTAPWDGSARLPTKTKFDGILIDAPCSGVGTWQRNPHARWTTTTTDVRELATIQLQLLNHVAPALKPGGRLIYSVCTLTRSETTAVAEAFAAAHPELEPHSLFGPGSAAPVSQLTILPHEINANGMFIAGWKRRA